MGRLALILEHKAIYQCGKNTGRQLYNEMIEFAVTIHEADPRTIAAFTILVNTHRGDKAARELIGQFAQVPLRSSSRGAKQLCESVLILPMCLDPARPRLDPAYPQAPGPTTIRGHNGFLPGLCKLICQRTPPENKGEPYALTPWPK
jgi:hypothetical protein